MPRRAAGRALIVGALLWMLWPVVTLGGAPVPVGRALLALVVLGLLVALVLYARSEHRLPAIGGALLAVAGLTVLLAAATVQFWLLPTEVASPGRQTAVEFAARAGALGLYLGGLLIGLAYRRGTSAERRAATLLLAALPVAVLLVALVGLPSADAFATHWPVGAALLALGLALR
jgi:uncharacterized membrane protein